MIKSGNDISSIVYAIRDELKERNASRDFALKTGMSKASISKMIYAENTRELLNIDSEVSYNAIYVLKPIMCEYVAELLNEGKSASEIPYLLRTAEDTAEGTAEDTAEDTVEDTAEDTAEDTRSEIVSQIFGILDNYDIAKDDMKLIKMLMKGLR